MTIEYLPLIVAALFGVVNCFYGYRLFQWLLTAWGLVLGASMAGQLAAQAFDGHLVAVVLASIVGGVIGASVFAALYYLGVFIVGAMFFATATDAVLQAFAVDMHSIFLIIPALIGGLLALVLQKLVIVLATAFMGALCTAIAGACWRYNIGLDEVLRDPAVLDKYAVGVVGVAFVLGLVGMVSQFLLTGKGVVNTREER